jgi:hypothetical protein
VAVLSTQKKVYEDEADKLKKDLNDGEVPWTLATVLLLLMGNFI